MSKENIAISFEKVYERDIDLYVINNICNYDGFLKLFIEKIGRKNDYRVISAESSLSDENGESDVTIVVENDNGKVGLLIEDKIDAIAMPNQSGRYVRRGNKGIKNGKYDEFFTFIIAPESYLNTNKEAQKYQYKISYEELLKIVTDEYGKAILSKALETKKKGYEPIEDKVATKFWTDYYEYIEKNKYDIDVYKTHGPRGSKAGWPHIRLDDKRVYIMHKSDRGYVDLTFSSLGEDYKYFRNYMEKYLEEGMTIHRTGKSMAIRMMVPCIDWHEKIEVYEEKELKEIMETILYLQSFFYSKIDVDELYNNVQK